jgi:MipA family protein
MPRINDIFHHTPKRGAPLDVDARLPRMKFQQLGVMLASFAFTTIAVADGTPVDDSTHLSVGPGMYLTPSYPGARSSRGFPLPYIDAEYDGRFYSNAADLLGVYAVNTSATQAGAAIQYDFTERLNDDDQRFRYLRDIKATPRIKLFASHTVGIFTGDANAATDVANRGQGTLVQGNLWVTLPFIPKFLLSMGPGLTWADERYMTSFFTITAPQAAVSSLPVYAARAGILDLHLNAVATLEISSRWSVGASAYAARLHADAGNSPVTLRRAQTTAMAWIVYKIK